MEVNFKFKIDDRVLTPFGANGIICMLGYDDGGVQYYIKAEKDSSWFKEKDIRIDEVHYGSE